MQTDLCTWKLVLAYDGTEFHGWQVQPGHPTVQGVLRDALARITGEDVLPQGSGRTDAGVHALGQVASFALAAPIPEANLARALNRILPAAIRVLSAARVASDFHARHSARAKTYEYRIFRSEICPPWLARYVYAWNAPLDVDAMQLATAYDGKVQWDDFDHTAYFFFYRDQMREWIFFTDLHTFKDRYELIQKNGIQGFCSWVLGEEDPEIWKFLPRHQ